MEKKEVYNFSPGPACLPKEVLKQVQDEFLSFDGQGYSVVEMFGRTKEFMDVVAEANKNIRGILSIPEDYECLWMHGGAY